MSNEFTGQALNLMQKRIAFLFCILDKTYKGATQQY